MSTEDLFRFNDAFDRIRPQGTLETPNDGYIYAIRFRVAQMVRPNNELFHSMNEDPEHSDNWLWHNAMVWHHARWIRNHRTT